MQDYTKDDFETLTPFEGLYKLKGNELQHIEALEQTNKLAKNFGILSFKKQYTAYCRQQNNITQYAKNESMTSFTGLDGYSLYCGDWECDDNGITQEINMGYSTMTAEACSHPIIPIERLTNIDTNIEKIKLAYKRRGKKWRQIIIDKKTISSNNLIIDLSNYGISVTSDTAKYMVKYFKDLDGLNYDEIPENQSISRMGWIENHGFVPFVDDLIFDGEANYRSIYESVHEKGSFNKWLELAKEVRQDGITARIILISSFASVLIKKVKGLPFFVHLWGGTEVGKTVGLMLATSVWANPEEAVYMQSLKNTDVFLEKMATFVNNMPLILDELQLIKDKKNFDNMIYSLTEGIGKGRGAKSGGIEKSGTWKNCILTSGEDPILNSNSGGGAMNRILEIECKEKLFKNAREVANTIQNNYGFAGKLFVEYLEDDDNTEKANEIFKKYISELEKENTTSKQAMAMAILLATDEIITELIFKDGNNLKVDEVKEFMHSKESVSVELRAYNYIYETIVGNSNKFLNSETTEIWGSDDDKYFYIISSRFNQICSDGNFNSQKVLSWMRVNNKISFEENRNTKTKRIGKNIVRCVCLEKERDFTQAELVADGQLPF